MTFEPRTNWLNVSPAMSRVSSSFALLAEQRLQRLERHAPAPPGRLARRALPHDPRPRRSLGVNRAWGIWRDRRRSRRTIATILGGRRAEAAKAAAAQAARTLPGVRAASAPAPVSAASGPTQMVVLARMLADERRQILDALGQASGDGEILRAGARQLDLSMRRWRASP